jgi:hypothetical protein
VSDDQRATYFQEVATAAQHAFDAVAFVDDHATVVSGIDRERAREQFMPGVFEASMYSHMLEAEHALYSDNMVVEPGIARNKALRENLFVVIVSIVNKIPVFVVGRPGTSKSLTLRLIANNLRGAQSQMPFWHRFPQVHVVPYQCSPHSTSDSILFQYGARFWQHAFYCFVSM